MLLPLFGSLTSTSNFKNILRVSHIAVPAQCLNDVDIVDRLPEAEAALAKSEKVLSELSGMLLVVDDDIEGWTIKLSLAVGRFAFLPSA